MSVKGLVEQLAGRSDANPILVSISGAVPPVSGTVEVSNFPAVQTVDGSVTVGNLPTTYPIAARLDNGTNTVLASTAEGHLEVAIHAPRTAFGSVAVDSLWPIYQCDAVYGVNTGQVLATTSLSGTATASNSSFVCSTGTTVFGNGVLQSRRRVRYRAGQGMTARWTALFSAPVTNSIQVAGVGHAEDGIYFGYNYNSSEFSILYSSRGKREVRSFTVTSGSTIGPGNVTITLNSVAFSVPITGASSAVRNAYELTQFTYAGWNAYCVGAIVYYVAASAGPQAGTFSYSQTGATNIVISTATTQVGVAATEVWIPQSSWNGDRVDGTGGSGFILNPAKYNVYQTTVQYLGAGSVFFFVEFTSANNNSDWALVHTIQNPNTRTTSSFGNPAFPFTMAAYSAGSTTDISVQSASFAGFVEGNKKLTGNRFCYFNTITTVGATNYQVLFTVQCSRYYANRTNQGVINIISVSAAIKHTQPCAIYLFRSTSDFRLTLAGNPNFQASSSTSCAVVDYAATTFTLADNSQLLWVGQLGETGQLVYEFGLDTMEESTLQPGEYLCVCARSSTGNPAYVSASINTREDI